MNGGIRVRALREALCGALLAMTCLAALVSADQSPASSAVPRASDGHPDLSGYWQVLNTAAWNIQDHSAQPGIPAGQGVVDGNEIPYQPWAAEKKKENFANRATADPESKCYLPGVPRLIYMPFPFQIAQTPKDIIMLSEYAHAVRTIHADGSAHPATAVESWLGDARARWEGDTLVVDVTNLNGKMWLDSVGNFYSENAHVTERFRLADANTMDYEVTIDDPTVFTRPFKLNYPLRRQGAGGGCAECGAGNAQPAAKVDPYEKESWEHACHEGNEHHVEGAKGLGFKWYLPPSPPGR